MAAAADGRFALTIGVTGHRQLDARDDVLNRAGVESLFDSLHRQFPDTPLRVLSPLAEGADRIPVEIALQRGYEVVAVLPMPIGDYERDFGADVDAFRDLIARIPRSNVFELPPIEVTGSFQPRGPLDRSARYEQAGDFVASHCHILLALWDGVANDLPGGTGEVVRYKLTGRGPNLPSVTELIELPDSGPVAWLHVARMDHAGSPPLSRDASVGTLQWLYPADRGREHFELLYRRIDEFNSAVVRRAARSGPSATQAPSDQDELDPRQQRTTRSFEIADALSIHYQHIGDRVLKVLIALGIVMTLAYEGYSRLLPVRAMLGVYLGAFALICGVYLWHRHVGALRKHLDYRALAEGLRVRLYWSLAGIDADVTGLYLRRQNDELQWIREALRESTPICAASSSIGSDRVYTSWIVDQVAYFERSALRLSRTGRWAKIASIGFFAAGLAKTAVLFVLWNHLDEMGAFGHWSIATVGSLPIVGALIDALSDSMGYSARAKQHAILTGIFSRAREAYETLGRRGGDESVQLRTLLHGLGREALSENEDWLTLRRERPMVLPDTASERTGTIA